VTTYSYAQLMGLWIQNGGSRATAAIAAAIAEAESSGNSAATSSNPDGGENVGLWQLDTNGKGSGYTAAQLSDPATNAHVAVVGSNDGRDWSAWETFVTGAYKRFLSGKTTPDTNVPGGAGTQPVTAQVTAYSPASCIWSFPGIPVPIIGNIGQFCIISKSQARAWIAVGFMIAGGLIALPGVSILVAAAGMRMLGAAGPVLEKTGAAVALIPGAEPLGVTIAGAGKAGTASAEQTQRRRAASDELLKREVGEPRETPDLETRGGTVRESTEGTERRRRASARSRARRAARPAGGQAAPRSETGF
jgi:hypothetical protein